MVFVFLFKEVRHGVRCENSLDEWGDEGEFFYFFFVEGVKLWRKEGRVIPSRVAVTSGRPPLGPPWARFFFFFFLIKSSFFLIKAFLVFT